MVAETITLACVGSKEPSDHPKMSEALSAMADCPEEIPGQGTTQMTGTDQADPLAPQVGTPAIPQAIAHPVGPSLTSPANLPDATKNDPLPIPPGQH